MNYIVSPWAALVQNKTLFQKSQRKRERGRGEEEKKRKKWKKRKGK